MMSGQASEEEITLLGAFRDQRIKAILAGEESTLFKIEKVSAPPPGKTRIFKSVTCEFCGEPVMEPRARIRDGKMCCIHCSQTYNRGW